MRRHAGDTGARQPTEQAAIAFSTGLSSIRRLRLAIATLLLVVIATLLLSILLLLRGAV